MKFFVVIIFYNFLILANQLKKPTLTIEKTCDPEKELKPQIEKLILNIKKGWERAYNEKHVFKNRISLLKTQIELDENLFNITKFDRIQTDMNKRLKYIKFKFDKLTICFKDLSSITDSFSNPGYRRAQSSTIKLYECFEQIFEQLKMKKDTTNIEKLINLDKKIVEKYNHFIDKIFIFQNNPLPKKTKKKPIKASDVKDIITLKD